MLVTFYDVRKAGHATSQVLENRLWDVFRSSRCAMKLFDGDVSLGARLLTLDIFSTMAECWTEFLEKIRTRGGPSTSRHFNTDKISPSSADREHVTDFSRAVRDLLEAIRITIEAIQLSSDYDPKKQRAFDGILIKARASDRAIRSIVEDIETNIEQRMARAERHINESQATSVKRLSIIAAIFLPLPMASSLLSMNARVRNLGPLWWDYIGIVVLVAFLVLSGYRLSTMWYKVWNNPALTFGLRYARMEYYKAKYAVLDRRKDGVGNATKPNKIGLSMSPIIVIDQILHVGPLLLKWVLGGQTGFALGYFRNRLRLERNSLVPWPNKGAFHVSRMLFIVGVLVSFPLGMFTTTKKGAWGLVYSAVSAVDLFVATVVLWRLQQLLWWMFQEGPKTRSRGDQVPR